LSERRGSAEERQVMNASRHSLLVVAWLLALHAGLLAAAPLIAATAPAPEISLSLRGAADQTVEQGEPLRIVVRIRAPRGGKETIQLAPTSGNWADAVRVDIVPISGGAAVAVAQAVGKPDANQATLDKTRVAGGLWRIPAEAMQQVSPGSYVLRARLTMAGGSGWNGETLSTPMRLLVVPGSNAPDRAVQRAVNRAHDALLIGNVKEAAALLDALLAKSPDDERLLMSRAVVAERAGNILAALLCANRAERTRPQASPGLPPLELQELQARLQQALPEAMKRADKPADWTWPPASVMAVSHPMSPPRPRSDAASAPAVVDPAPAATPKEVSAPPPGKPVSPLPIPANAPGIAKLPAPTVGAPSPGEIVPSNQLNDATIRGDTAGQWAVSAVAGSQYGKTQYSAAQATGAPNISIVGNSPDAWCPANKDRGTDWLEVTFGRPVHASEVRVRQNDTVGAITKIEAIEPDGTVHVWWEGTDTPPATREIVWFAVRVPKTGYLVAKAKISLNLAAMPGWKEIDAVQLVGAPE
jgi:hypothetical protein